MNCNPAEQFLEELLPYLGDLDAHPEMGRGRASRVKEGHWETPENLSQHETGPVLFPFDCDSSAAEDVRPGGGRIGSQDEACITPVKWVALFRRYLRQPSRKRDQSCCARSSAEKGYDILSVTPGEVQGNEFPSREQILILPPEGQGFPSQVELQPPVLPLVNQAGQGPLPVSRIGGGELLQGCYPSLKIDKAAVVRIDEPQIP